jgi:hypothetical protein
VRLTDDVRLTFETFADYSMLRRAWSRAVSAWWGPYLGVVLCAVVAGLLIALFVLMNKTELLRVLRASGL